MIPVSLIIIPFSTAGAIVILQIDTFDIPGTNAMKMFIAAMLLTLSKSLGEPFGHCLSYTPHHSGPSIPGSTAYDIAIAIRGSGPIDIRSSTAISCGHGGDVIISSGSTGGRRRRPG